MNPIINRIAKKIELCLRKIEFIEGIIYFGSFGRRDHDFYSDLDIFIYLNESNNSKEKTIVKERLIELLKSDEEGISIDFEIYNKWIIFTHKTFIKIEILIKNITEAKNDVIFIVESKIQDLQQAIVYDKNNRIKQIYAENWIYLNDSLRLKNLFIEEAYKFIYYFEGFVSNIARDDEYKAYMNYTIAFYKLAGLKAIVEGEYYNLYQPSHFTTKIVDNWDMRVKYYRTSAGLRKYDMMDQRNNFKNLFLEILRKGITKFKLYNHIYSEFEGFFNKINEKFLPFENIRDISLIPNTFSNDIKVKKNLIYRAASLSKNDKDLILSFLKENNISYILDLRGNYELTNCVRYNNFYDEKIKKSYVINIPLEPEMNINNPYEQLYKTYLENFCNEFNLIFEKYFLNSSENKVIIHCEEGKDRTGVVIALLLDLLGVSRDLIVEDYLLSYSDTKRKNIETFFNTLDNNYGGSENYLTSYCNVSKGSIYTIREILVEK